jgi:hypothetical protein
LTRCATGVDHRSPVKMDWRQSLWLRRATDRARSARLSLRGESTSFPGPHTTDSLVRIRELVDSAPMLQHFLSERGFVYGSLIGECGLLISLATINLEMGKRYFEAAP